MAVDLDGKLLGKKTGAGINFNATSMINCTENLYNIIEELKAQGGFNDYDTLSIGMSALDDIASPEIIKEFAGKYFDEKKLIMNSDVYIALYGLSSNDKRNCAGSIMIVSGTGMMGVAVGWKTEENTGIKKEQTYISGGWGYLLNDEGSCYYIANEGIRKAFGMYESNEQKTELLHCLCEFYNIKNPRKLISIIYSSKAPNETIASFAPVVIKCARDGDKISYEIIHKTINILCNHTNNLAKKIGAEYNTEFNIGINGGLFENNQDVLNEYINRIKKLYKNANIGFPTLRPEFSAVLYATKVREYPFNIDFSKL